MRRFLWLTTLVVVATLTIPGTLRVRAHQPFFEEEDIKANAPWPIDDPTISTALYATLESRIDVDYFTFEGQAGQSVLLELTIPQIEGQENFAPTMALLGPGLPSADLPRNVNHPTGVGATSFPPPPGPASEFFERFSGTSYWERQEQRVTLPSDGRYVVAVWHDTGESGRYVFVIGHKERLGGDPGFAVKLDTYWTPVTPAPAEAPAAFDRCWSGS